MDTTQAATLVTAVLGGPFALGALKAWERVASKRIAADEREGHECDERIQRMTDGLTKRLDEQSTEIRSLSVNVASCEAKHAQCESRVGALDNLVQRLASRLHDTDPPPSPAE